MPGMRAPGKSEHGAVDRRSLLGRLSALIGVPLLLGSRATESVASAFDAQPEKPDRPSGGLRIAAPDHSVKRRG
jgi:hypothetical protein